MKVEVISDFYLKNFKDKVNEFCSKHKIIDIQFQSDQQGFYAFIQYEDSKKTSIDLQKDKELKC